MSTAARATRAAVSVLFNEPKLLKFTSGVLNAARGLGFSALQRAEIAEIRIETRVIAGGTRFSALQRAEIAEIETVAITAATEAGFSALQRAEIAEIDPYTSTSASFAVSVLFNEPKLLKSFGNRL